MTPSNHIPSDSSGSDGPDDILRQIGELRLKTLFESDVNGDGRVSMPEFTEYCKLRGMADVARAEELFHRLDVDGDGFITSLDDITGDHVIDEHDVRARRSTVHERTPYSHVDHDITPHSMAALHAISEGSERVELVQRSHHLEKEGTTALHIFDVPIVDLPPELDGVSILQLSDIHFKVGSGKAIRKITDLKKLLTRLQIAPDAIVCTGDYLSTKKEDISDADVTALRSLDFGCPRFFVLGNHDFGDGEVEIEGTSTVIRRQMEAAGYQDATDKIVPLEIDGRRINFVGVDDAIFGDVRVPDMTRAKNDVNILLTHSLDALHNGFPGCLDLVLSGHLHSGEVRIGAMLDGVRYMIGRYYDDLNKQQRGWKPLSRRTLSYIQPGFSTLTPFRRYGAEAEGATLLRLRRYKG